MNKSAIIALLALLLAALSINVPNTYSQTNAWRINAGGSVYTDVHGNTFSEDTAYTPGGFGYSGQSRTNSYSNPIAGTADPLLYQSVRSSRPFSYLFDVPNGEYVVTLHFVEPWESSAGARLFDVAVEGVVALNNYDIFDAAGGKLTAVSETVNASVSDGQLAIDFIPDATAPVVAAIEVVSTGTAPLEPDIAVTPAVLDFGNVVAGTTRDESVTVNNEGTADLTISSLVTTEPAFTVLSPATPVVIAPGSSTAVTVRFSPASANNNYSDNLVIGNDDPDEGTLSVALSGDGTLDEPDISVNPESLAFGQVVLGSTADQTVTINNDGTQPLTVSGLTIDNAVFSVVGATTPFDVPAGGNATVAVRFTPGTETAESGILSIGSNDPDESVIAVALSGSGVTTPAIAYRINAGGNDYTTVAGNLFVADKSYTAGDFGYTGSSRATTYTSAVNGTGDDLLYQSVRTSKPFSYLFDVANGDYQITFHFVEPFKNGPGQRQFDVAVEGQVVLDDYDVFAAAGGQLTAVTESISASISDGQLTIAFTGVVDQPVLAALEVVATTVADPEPDISAAPTALDYGDVATGASSDRQVTLTNDGTANLQVTGLSTTDAAFTVVAPAVPVTLLPGNNTIVTVRFSPTTTGPYAGNLEISSDDPDEPLVTMALNGNGIEPPPSEPDIRAEPTVLDFGQVTMGATSDKMVAIHNDGAVTLTIDDLTLANSTFALVNVPATPFTVAPSQNTSLTIRFTPAAETQETGELIIASDDPDEPTSAIALSGTGVATPPYTTRLNVGGSAYTTADGQIFSADQAYSAGAYGHSGQSRTNSFSNAISSTEDDVLYQSVRTSRPFSYLFDVQNGSYVVTLHFVEPFKTSADARLFDVVVEGQIVLDNYDVFDAAGSQMAAITESITTEVVDGQLNVDFVSVADMPILAAIEVLSTSTSNPTPDIAVSSVIRLMPLGDSITFGTYGSSVDTRSEAEVPGYRQPLYLSLAEAGHAINFVGSLRAGYGVTPAFDADHEGHSGQTDEWIATRVYGYLQANPADIVLLHIGTNMLNSSPADVEMILNEIDRYEADYDAEVTVLLARIINRKTYSATTTQFNDNVESMALARIANGDRIIIVDQESALTYADDMSDNLHPNDTGYQKMADTWLATLDTFLANVQYGDVAVSAGADVTVTITNNGAALLTVSDLAVSNPAFSIVSGPASFTVAPGASQVVTVRFAPTTTGMQTAVLTITSDDPDKGTVTLTLRGNGVAQP